MTNNSSWFEEERASISHRKFNVFERCANSSTLDPGPPSAICSIHPDAPPEVKALTFAQRELIYHQTRGHDSCYKAMGIFEFFFQLCTPGQKLKIQLRDEVCLSP